MKSLRDIAQAAVVLSLSALMIHSIHELAAIDVLAALRRMWRGKNRALQMWVDAWVFSGCFPHLSLLVGKLCADGAEEELFFHAAGLADKDKSTRCDRNTIFRMYSMTKPVTTVAALMLIDRGLLKIDDLVSKYIPSFAGLKVLSSGGKASIDSYEVENPIHHVTIRHLLTHTSGISYGLFGNSIPDQLIQKFSGDEQRNFYCNMTSQQLCDVVAKVPLAFQPGSAFMYGLNNDVLGRVIEVASGESLDSFFMKEIFLPLRMDKTMFYIPKEWENRMSGCYELKGVTGDSASGYASVTYKASENMERNKCARFPMISGGGGLCSTADDYRRFACFLLRRGATEEGQQLLSAELVDAMTTNQLPGGATLSSFSHEKGAFSESIGEGIGYGFGVSVVVEPSLVRGGEGCVRGEFGWGGMAGTWFFVCPTKRLYAVLLTSMIPSSAFPIRPQLRSLVHRMFKS